MVPYIEFGLLAHSHVWKSPAIQTKEAIDGLLDSGMEQLAHPSDPPALICIADLGCWTMIRQVYDGPRMMPPEAWAVRQARTGLPEQGGCWVALMRHTGTLSGDYDPPIPIAAAITFLLERLAHDNAPVRPLAQYFQAAGLSGSSASVTSKFFPLDVLSAELRANLPHRLTAGVRGSDWSVIFQF
jgi:hypothetical protein